jgi:hypothetical protein
MKNKQQIQDALYKLPYNPNLIEGDVIELSYKGKKFSSVEVVKIAKGEYIILQTKDLFF